MKKVVAYIAGVPSMQKNPHKTEILHRFVQGVNLIGDQGIANTTHNLIDADVAVIQGWVHEGSPNSPHLQLRRNVFDFQKRNNKHTIIVDSNLFNYKDKNPSKTYHRYGLNGVFPTTANYFTNNLDETRWMQISRDLNIQLKDWRSNGNHILICTQRNGGWSMQGLDVPTWLHQTVRYIRKISDRPIIVRPHPGDKAARSYLQDTKFYSLSRNESILDDFKNAWCVVTYNSTPGVAASIEGIPAFITDPNSQNSQAYEVANCNLQQIETPILKDRLLWVQKLSMSHWNFDELSSGSAWNFIKNYC